MNMIIFAAGAIGYAFFEIAFRGYTHWTMMLTGGACVLTIYYINQEMQDKPLLFRAILGTVVILIFELAVGLVVNLWFGWGIWDYSGMRWNLLGQICPPFGAAWFLLSLGLCWISDLTVRRSVKADK